MTKRIVMLHSHPLLIRFVGLVLLPLLAAVIGAFLYFTKSLPRAGNVQLLGEGTITVSRDQFGVATLKADSDRDIFFATGYVHAQDRGWQLELLRRTAQGRLSEVFGKATLNQDIWLRTLGIHRAAESAKNALSKDALASLEAYAEGVNRGLESERGLPPEMIAFGIKPEKWTPTDSLAVIKLLALNLAGSMNSELERYVALQLLDEQKMRLLFGPSLQLIAEERSSGRADMALADSIMARSNATESLLGIGGKFVGSNAWVVSGAHTVDGKPLLANDPHMALSMPSPWYAVKQLGKTLDVAGTTLVGTPLVIFGKNKSIAWGGTNMMADVQDLFFEQVRGSDPRFYKDQDQWKPLQVRYETIKVSRPNPQWLYDPVPPVRIRIRESARGPLINDALSHFDQPVALRWTALDPDDTSYEAFYRLSYASNWVEFRRALSQHVAPVLNMLYADAHNNIGYIAAGRIPVRARGQGALPEPGWNGEYRWVGQIAPDQMPSIYNPPQGYIVSANNKMDGNIYSGFITMDWAPDYRANRIKSLLDTAITNHQRIDSRYFMFMQRDMLASDAADLVPLLLRVSPASELEKSALLKLKTWNYQMDTESAGAAIYIAWTQQLQKELMRRHLPGFQSAQLSESVQASLTGNLTPAVMREAILGNDAGLCESRGCQKELSTALASAVHELSKLAGSDPADWRWGSIHHLRLSHRPFSQVPLIKLMFERRYEHGGGPYTVNVGNANFIGSVGYEQTFGATFRQIIQPGNGVHLFVASSGQSGNPFSGNFADMSGLYVNGSYIQFPTHIPDRSGVSASVPKAVK